MFIKGYPCRSISVRIYNGRKEKMDCACQQLVWMCSNNCDVELHGISILRANKPLTFEGFTCKVFILLMLENLLEKDIVVFNCAWYNLFPFHPISSSISCAKA